MKRNKLSPIAHALETRVMLAAGNDRDSAADETDKPQNYLDVVETTPQSTAVAPEKIRIPRFIDDALDEGQDDSDGDGKERGGYFSVDINEDGKRITSETLAEIGTSNSISLNDDNLVKKAEKNGDIIGDFHTHPGVRDSTNELDPEFSSNIPHGGFDIAFAAENESPGSFVRSASGHTYLALDTEATSDNVNWDSVNQNFESELNNHYIAASNQLRNEIASKDDGDVQIQNVEFTDEQHAEIRRQALLHASVTVTESNGLAFYSGDPGKTVLKKVVQEVA